MDGLPFFGNLKPVTESDLIVNFTKMTIQTEVENFTSPPVTVRLPFYVQVNYLRPLKYSVHEI